jgi:hypothetical protein
MTVDTSHTPGHDRPPRRPLQWEIRTIANERPAGHDPALDGSYGCDGCAAPVVPQLPRPPQHAHG